MAIKKLYRITLKNNKTKEVRTVSTWFDSIEEIESTVTKLMPFTSIESITEVTSETLKVKTV